MAAGEIPAAPMAGHLQAGLVDVDHGSVTFRCRPDASHYNPIGAVHGGLACSLLDSALGCATHTTLPAGTGYTSIEIKVNYLRSVRVDSALSPASAGSPRQAAGSPSPRSYRTCWSARSDTATPMDDAAVTAVSG